jgi:hypothetical protein
MFVHVDVELGQDAEPHVFRSNLEVLVFIVGFDRGIYEAIVGRVHVGFGGDILKGALDDVIVFDFLIFLWTRLAEKFYGVGYWIVEAAELTGTVRRRIDRDWHFARSKQSEPWDCNIQYLIRCF